MYKYLLCAACCTERIDSEKTQVSGYSNLLSPYRGYLTGMKLTSVLWSDRIRRTPQARRKAQSTGTFCWTKAINCPDVMVPDKEES